MSHFPLATVEAMVKELRAGIASGARTVTTEVSTAKIWLDAYLLLAKLREHSHGGEVLKSIEGMLLAHAKLAAETSEPDSICWHTGAEAAFQLLYELIAGERWSPSAAENLARERHAYPLRVLRDDGRKT